METFFGILFIFIIIWGAINKKGRQKDFPRPLSRFDDGKLKKTSFNSPPPLPSDNNSDTHLYFGDDWKTYLIKHHGKYVLWPSNFFDIIDRAILKLSVTERYLLQQDLKDTVRKQLLYQFTHNILKDDKFSVENMTRGFRMLINSRQTVNIAREVSSHPTTKSPNLQHAMEQATKILANNPIIKLETPSNHNQQEPTIFTKEEQINSIDNLETTGLNNVTINEEAIIDVDDTSESLTYTKEELPIENERRNGTSLSLSIDDILNQIRSKHIISNSEESPVVAKQQDGSTSVSYDQYEYDNWKLGKRFKNKMGLSKDQVLLVNKVTGIHNVFTSVDGCCMQTISLFLEIVKQLEKKLDKQGTSVNTEIQRLTESAIQINRNTGEGYWYFYDDYSRKNFPIYIEQEVYTTIFKRGENVVRSVWEHKRKISSDYPAYFTGLASEFDTRLGNYVDEILPTLTSFITEPDFNTELELNKQNTTRWKVKFESLKQTLTDDTIVSFVKKIHALFKANVQNPSAENIFFEASKIVASYDKIEAIRLYLYYVNADMKSDKIDDKQLTKTIQKALFKNAQHQTSFTEIVDQLKKDKNIISAIKKANNIYEPVRKKINLNLDTINVVKEQDKNTVDLLNALLQDNNETESALLQPQASSQNKDEESEIIGAINLTTSSKIIDDIKLNNIQSNLIYLFADNDFSIRQEEITEYAQKHGMRLGPLINDINEICYEVLDDNLLEERDEDFFDMNEEYYNMIIKP